MLILITRSPRVPGDFEIGIPRPGTRCSVINLLGSFGVAKLKVFESVFYTFTVTKKIRDHFFGTLFAIFLTKSMKKST